MSIKVRSCRRAIAIVLVTLGAAACGPRSEPAAPSSPAGDDPGRRLTHDECVAAVDHAIALFDASADMAAVAVQLRGERASSIAQCEASATLRDHRCLMKATTASELGLCPMPGAQ
jgi:hypothetical protein